ncbi:MAG: 3-dehydroquinate synthase family protein [Phycisphaerales bacterium]
MPEARTIRVEHPSTLAGEVVAYDVVVGTDLYDSIARRVGASAHAVLVADRAVEPFAREIARSLGLDADTRLLSLDAGESCKTPDSLTTLLTSLASLDPSLTRDGRVIAVGGGALLDLAGLAASLHKRGVAWVALPTTLLGMVDASVGGKTGINLRHASDGALLKNAIGTFHQPTLVLADVATLRTLPAREFRSGLAECIKHAMIAAPDTRLNRLLSGSIPDDPLDWLESNAKGILSLDSPTLIELIAWNVSIKAAVVARDPQERLDTSRPKLESHAAPSRMWLNLGHTFAHVLEASGELLHGEAVGLGLIAACSTRNETAELAERVRSLLQQFRLPIQNATVPEAIEFVRIMARDKKNTTAAPVRLVLPSCGGGVEICDHVDVAAIARGLDAIRVSYAHG